MNEWSRSDLIALIGLVIAVVSCVAAILAIPNLLRRYRAKDILILVPRNKQEISILAGEHRPIVRTVGGEVIGFTRREIEELGLFVEVLIKTDRWYLQGDVPVDTNGKWALKDARFGGFDHIIRAILKDRHSREYQSSEIEVSVL